MIDALQEALARPGLWWLGAAVILAGLVRGFSGFGTALILIPVAARVVPPHWTLILLVVIDSIGPLPNLPRALRDGAPREVVTLVAGMLVGLPLGLWVLAALPVETFRWVVSIVALVMLALLMSGWRWHGAHGGAVSVAAGGVSGFLGGSTGMAGPPVILYYMVQQMPVAKLRANLLLFFVGGNAALLGYLALAGRLELPAVMLGLALAPVFLAANVVGAALFRPQMGTLYRRVAYALVAGAALSGLPIWG